MKEFPAESLSRGGSDLFEAATVAPVVITEHRKPRYVVMAVEHFEALTRSVTTQVVVDVRNMPDHLGELLDMGIKDHFDGR